MIDLSLLDKTKTNALVIRHAERNDMQKWQIDQPLNEEGKKHATELGEKLKGFGNYVFFSSPVDRCCETVEYMQKGIFDNGTKPYDFSDLLGKPGAFVVDRNNNAFRKNPSCIDVVMAQIAHEKLEGIRPTEEGAKLLTDFAVGQMNIAPEGTLLVFVTHDAIIAPLIFELTGEKFDRNNWPDFSDGIIIEKCSETDYKVIRKGNCFKLRCF